MHLPPYRPEDQQRVEHSRLRRRMLEGRWDLDLHRYARAELGTDREQVQRMVDLSSNAYRASCQAVSVLYDRPPIVGHADTEAASLMVRLLDDAGWAPLMARVQRDTSGLREMLIRVDAVPGGVELRPVPPDMVWARPDPVRRDMPIEVAELVQYQVGDRLVWCWDVSDASGSGSRKVVTAEQVASVRSGQDVTGRVGVSQLWTDAAGRPVLPFALYHASRTGYLWDTYEGIEAIDGTMAIGVLWSMWRHLVRSASWPQRYVVGAQVAGLEQADDGSGRAQIATDPTTVLMLERTGEGDGQPMVGQWAPGGDPAALASAIGSYERRVVAAMGLSPADASRTSGDPRSGYALEVSRESQRAAARRLEPQFRRGDLELLRIVAVTWNSTNPGQRLPETGWTISYQSLPPSQGEIDSIVSLLDAGLVSRVDAYIALHPGMSYEQARAELALIDGERAEPAPPVPTMPQEQP